jgi:hypothetical protein
VRVAFCTHLTKLIEGKGAGEALTRLPPASRRERGRMRLESFMVIMRACVRSRNRTKLNSSKFQRCRLLIYLINLDHCSILSTSS